MRTIYVVSTSACSGKSVVVAGLMARLAADGLRPGYFKPFGRVTGMEGGKLVDTDAVFMAKEFGLGTGVDVLCPAVHSQDLLVRALKGKGVDLLPKVMKAFKTVSAERDCVVAAGPRDLEDGGFLGLPPSRLADEMDAKVLVVDPYGGEVSVDLILAAKRMFGDRLLGAVVNRTPAGGVKHVRDLAGPYLNKHGVPLMGVLPGDKRLSSVPVKSIAEAVGGRVLTSRAPLDAMVENLMIGAMDVEGALKFFRKTPNKAVITGGHRSDVQLAALETSTACLVLTGNMPPNDIILARAEEKGVPVILARDDTLTTVNAIESALGKVRLRGSGKVAEALKLMEEHFDFDALYKAAGILKKVNRSSSGR